MRPRRGLLTQRHDSFKIGGHERSDRTWVARPRTSPDNSKETAPWLTAERQLDRPGPPADRSAPKSSVSSTPTGAPPTTSLSARSTCSTTRCCAGPSEPKDVKPRLLGHWGTTPGLKPDLRHMNREIKTRDLNAIYIIGPGHGGPGLVANTYLEGSYTQFYPSITRDEDGIRKLFRQFSFPAASPATSRPKHPAPSTRARAGLLALARVRGGLRQPRPAGLLHRPATARPKPARWQPAGIRTSSSIPKATAPSCRSCISTATRSPIQRSSPASRSGSCAT